MHYVGTLLDGTKFDSSRDRDDPFSFKLGQGEASGRSLATLQRSHFLLCLIPHSRTFAGQVIKGWDVGLASMTKGEKALLTCKPEFAYGAQGSPPKIPPDSTLNFEVELLRWQSSNDVSGDGGVIKKVLVEPSEMRGPGQNDEARSEWRGGDWVCGARGSPPSSHSYSHLPHMMLSRVFHAPWIIDRPLDPHAAAAS